MPLTQEQTLLSIATAVQGTQIYSAFLPSIFTIRTFAEHSGTATDIRTGEAIASGLVIALGITTGAIVDHSGPIWLSLFVVLVMVSVYEWALRSRRGRTDTDEDPGLALVMREQEEARAHG